MNWLSGKQASSFSVYQEDSLADRIVEMVDKEEAIELVSSAAIKDQTMSSGGILEPDFQFTITILTTLRAVYNFLSAYGPGAFSQSAEILEYDSASQFKLIITKVGFITGDIHLQICGTPTLIHDALSLNLSRNQSSNGTTVTTLVSDETVLNSLKVHPSIKLTISNIPYSLAPGYKVSLTSPNTEQLSVLLMKISIEDSDMSENVDFQISDFLKFKRPPLAVKRIWDSIEVDLNSGFHNQEYSQEDAKKPETQSYRLLELTKSEVTFLIGKGGKKIEKIRQKSNAVVKVIPLKDVTKDLTDALYKNPLARQFLRISGTVQQINEALKMIENEIYQFRSNGIVSY